MTDWLDIVKDISSIVILGVGAGGLVLVSVGLTRALSIGFRRYFKITYPLSIRKSEIKQLSDLILRMEKGDYIAVTGGKGIGKTCLIDTALNVS